MPSARCLLLVVALLPLLGRAEFAAPTLAPVDRLIANTEERLKERPNDAQLHYLLGRVHYLAFAKRSAEALVWPGRDEDPQLVGPCMQGHFHIREAQLRQRAQADTLAALGFATEDAVPMDQRPDYWQAVIKRIQELRAAKWQPPPPIPREQAIAHAQAADAAFRRSLQLAPQDPLTLLGLASLWRQADEWAAQEGIANPLPDATPPRVRDQFYAAFLAARPGDRKSKYRPLMGLCELVSHEAGTAYLALTEQQGENKEVATRRKEVSKHLERLRKLPDSGIVTPIVFSLAPGARRLADVLDPERIVTFDLDGDGTAELRPWLQPTTALLVWDPLRTGTITSGRQLFGSVSWWLFFADGYQALDALDDNRDGELAGAELAGIRAWFDANRNGHADAGEVVDLDACGIVGLRVAADHVDDGSPAARQGLRLADGRRLPTWDWLAPAVPPALLSAYDAGAQGAR
jgi:hypothetical protein